MGRYCVKFFQNNSESVYLLGWVGIMSSFLHGHFFLFSICFSLLFFNEYLQHVFEHTKNTYRMPLLTPNKKTHSHNFSKGVPHEQPWSSIVCLLWGSSIVSSFFWKWTFSKILFSFPFLFPILFSFLLSSVLLEFSKCLISQNIGCLLKTQ